jgi:hypothetical protein
VQVKTIKIEIKLLIIIKLEIKREKSNGNSSNNTTGDAYQCRYARSDVGSEEARPCERPVESLGSEDMVRQ